MSSQENERDESAEGHSHSRAKKKCDPKYFAFLEHVANFMTNNTPVVSYEIRDEVQYKVLIFTIIICH